MITVFPKCLMEVYVDFVALTVVESLYLMDVVYEHTVAPSKVKGIYS